MTERWAHLIELARDTRMYALEISAASKDPFRKRTKRRSLANAVNTLHGKCMGQSSTYSLETRYLETPLLDIHIAKARVV
jgi:hypothetical protein